MLIARNNGRIESSPGAYKCPKSEITLIKLSSSTHGWDSGQKMYSLEYTTNDY